MENSHEVFISQCKLPIEDLGDYLKGVNDCRDGVPHEAGKSISYDRGYAIQYESEQLIYYGGSKL